VLDQFFSGTLLSSVDGVQAIDSGFCRREIIKDMCGYFRGGGSQSAKKPRLRTNIKVEESTASVGSGASCSNGRASFRGYM